MTPKQAVSLVNRTAKKERRIPTPAQVMSFLVADGFLMSEPYSDGSGLSYRRFTMEHPAQKESPYEFDVPQREQFDSVRRVWEICENLSIIKGNKLEAVEIMTIIAKIEVAP